MKTRAVYRRPRADAMHAAPRGARADRSPPVARRTRVSREPAMCERCGAVYRRKTWRGGDRTFRAAFLSVGWTLCPACAQVADQEYFGRVRVAPPVGSGHEAEIRSRIKSVEQRARHTQPERRVVSIAQSPTGLEILTTSQKLAHRIARELVKAFGGKVRFLWTDPDRTLEAVWTPPARWSRPHRTVRIGARRSPA